MQDCRDGGSTGFLFLLFEGSIRNIIMEEKWKDGGFIFFFCFCKGYVEDGRGRWKDLDIFAVCEGSVRKVYRCKSNGLHSLAAGSNS